MDFVIFMINLGLNEKFKEKKKQLFSHILGLLEINS